MDPELAAMLGQGASVLFHGKIHTIDQDARLSLSLTHGAMGDALPSDEGFVVSTTGDATTRSGPGAFTFSTSGALLSDLEVEATVDRSTGSGEVGLDFELWATVLPA